MKYKITVTRTPLSLFSPERELSYCFNKEKRLLRIETSGSIAMGNYKSINVVDNNIDFISASNHSNLSYGANNFTYTGEYPSGSYLNEEKIMTTVGAVNEESSNALSKKVHAICSNLYEPTEERWPEAINVQFVNSGTDMVYKDFWVQMKSSATPPGFSSWSFTNNENSTMLIKQRAIHLNKRGKMADLNLLALFFILKTALPRVNLFSKDKGVKNYLFYYAT